MQQVFQSAWNPGEDLASDEQTIGFQGQHAGKLRIIYKDEGHGFQCDALCDKFSIETQNSLCSKLCRYQS
jgi:hypothetical protein